MVSPGTLTTHTHIHTRTHTATVTVTDTDTDTDTHTDTHTHTHTAPACDVALADSVQTIASPSKPLVLLVDDMQWADPSSLRLLQALLVRPTLNI